MKLSVIIVSYNEVEYISEAIESCLKQSFQNFEIIIGDDGSSDGSLELIQQYTDRYPEKVKYFVMDRPEGEVILASYRVSNVIKRALDMAQGEYVLCLSGDDFYHDYHIFEDQVRFLDSDCKKQYSACVSNYQLYWNNGEKEECVFIPYTNSLSWSGGYVHLSCFMFRKSVYDQGAFLDHFCDDCGLAYSLAFSGKWKYIDRNVFSYRQRDKSIMHEADILELKLLEVMLYQDVSIKKKMMAQSYARFYGQVKYVYTHRAELGATRYEKYRVKSSEYENDLIGFLEKYDSAPLKDKNKFFWFMRKAQFFAWFYFFWRVVFSFVPRLKFKRKHNRK